MTIAHLDFFRWFCIIQALIVCCASFMICLRYGFKLGQNPKNVLFWHVVLVSISYVGAIGYIMITKIERLGQPFSWRLPLAAFVFMSGDAGLCFMLAHIYSYRVYAKNTRDRLIQEEMAVTEANTRATEKNTEAITKQP